MIKIGIISGEGELPLSIGKSLIRKNYKVCFFNIKNFANPKKYKSYENIEIELNSFSKILKVLKEKNINKIIMAGKVLRPSVRDIKFDLNTISLIKEYFLESKGDDQLLKIISNFFLKKGFALFDWKKICNELFAYENHLTVTKPSKNAIMNKNKGLNIFKIIGKADIGQSLVIQNQLILGVESIEGTDELIKRCRNYKKQGDKGILLKLSKYLQHNELDLPTIGLQTIKNLKNFDYEGLFIERSKCVIIDKEKVINFCNKNNLFLSTVVKID